MKSTSIKLPENLVEMAQEKYDTRSKSEAVLNSIIDFLILQRKNKKLDYTPVAKLPKSERDIKISLRIEQTLIDAIDDLITENDSILIETTRSEVVKIMIAEICTTQTKSSSKNPIKLMGSKWDKRMQESITHIFNTSEKRWLRSVETCAGALGIHMNVEVADERIINDLDFDKANLYRCIQKNPNKVLKRAVKYKVNKETYKAEYEIYKSKMSDPPTLVPDYDASSRYLFLSINAYKQRLGSFEYNSTQLSYFRRLGEIMPMHNSLIDVKVTENDIFDIIRKYGKTRNTIFIVDPPYLKCSDYKKSNFKSGTKEFQLDAHRKLAKQLKGFAKRGNDFIYFCRITASGRRRLSADKLAEADCLMEYHIDRLYGKSGFYYMDVALDKGTIERIITTFPFENAKEY